MTLATDDVESTRAAGRPAESSLDTPRVGCAEYLAALARQMTLPTTELAVIEGAFLAGVAWASRQTRRAGLRPMPADVTPRQREALRAFAIYQAHAGMNPRLDDLAAALGVCRATAYELVDTLIQKKCLRRDGGRRGRARGVSLAVLVPLRPEDLA